MSDERNRPARISTQRAIGWMTVLLGIAWLAFPFWFYAGMTKGTPLDMFLLLYIWIGLPIVWLGVVLVLTSPRAKKRD